MPRVLRLMWVALAQGGIGLGATVLYLVFSDNGQPLAAWAIVCVAAVICTGITWLWVERPRELAVQRRVRGLCLACGYDLRATPGRCPECGSPAPYTPA